MNSATVAITALLCILTLVLPRYYSTAPLLACLCWVSAFPRIFIGPLDFPAFRILVCFGIARIIFLRENPVRPINQLDRLFFLWCTAFVIIGTIETGTTEGFINRLGEFFNSALVYLIFRSSIREPQDLDRLIKVLALVLFPVALLMLYEKLFYFNCFSFLEGRSTYPYIRNGHVRAQGAFAHPILAGNVGAICLPLFPIILKSTLPKSRLVAYLGVLACLLMVFTSGSSGPVMTLMLCSFGIAMWPFRYHIKLIALLSIAAIATLHLIMKDPVWFLMARIDLAGGSTGWHRAYLISSALQHIHEWWLLGTEYTRHWMPTGVSWSPNHTDITNHYIWIGVKGGLVSIILFLIIIAQCFRYLGSMFAYLDVREPSKVIVIWILGSILFCHTITFISVAYFDQTISFFYALIAIISSLFNYYTSNYEYTENVNSDSYE